ncbi:hypothetical protein HMI56_004813 [Coelomomyces lativittatus]|nr:hypothetical protein HMI56_004813 [Coelomomyces lativittatus]
MHRRREYSPSRRTRFYTEDNTPDNRARSYTDVVVDEYGGFARHKRDGPRHSHIKNSNADSGGSTSSKENIHNEDDLILERSIYSF